MNLVKSTPAGFPANTVSRTYTITPNGGSGFSATLRLRYKDTELNGLSESTLELWRFNGSSWTSPAGVATRDTTHNWIEETGIAAFSPWAIAGSSGPTLVKLISFTAIGYDSSVLLEWQTGFEADNLGFNLYRDESGKRTVVNTQLIAGSALTFVPGENDGQLDSNDSVEFYGLGLNTPSSDTRVYWLIGGWQLGLRISKTPSDRGYPSGESVPFTVERRDRTIYSSALRNGDDENFFGAVVSSSPIDQRLTLNSLAQPAGESAVIEVSLQGVTNLAHQVGVNLNGSSIGQLFFNGQAKGEQRIYVPQALLRGGENIVTLQSINGPSDISLVDWIRITYQHSHQADSDSLSFVLPAGQSATISGFSSKNIRVLDSDDLFERLLS